MSEQRKGAMTPAQEKILDKLVFKGGFKDVIDGPMISIIDNQGIDRVLRKASDEAKEIVYQTVDMIFEGLETLVKD